MQMSKYRRLPNRPDEEALPMPPDSKEYQEMLEECRNRARVVIGLLKIAIELLAHHPARAQSHIEVAIEKAECIRDVGEEAGDE